MGYCIQRVTRHGVIANIDKGKGVKTVSKWQQYSFHLAKYVDTVYALFHSYCAVAQAQYTFRGGNLND